MLPIEAGLRLKTDHMGLVWLAPGDVIEHEGQPCVVDYVNDCRARCMPTKRKMSEFEDGRTGEKVVIKSLQRSFNISCRVPSEIVLARNGQAWLLNWLAEKSPRRAAKLTKEGGGENNNMPNQALARGGLAADAYQAQKSGRQQQETTVPTKTKKAAKAKSAPKAKSAAKAKKSGSSRSSLGEIHGFTVSSVARRLGKEGLTGGHVHAILEVKGIKASRPGINTMVFNGRKGIGGEPAALTKEQVEELVKAAPAPTRGHAKEAK